MPKRRLTATAVEKIKPPVKGQVEHYDLALPGFGLRASYSGAKSWFVMARVAGKMTRFTLGSFPTMSLAEARQRAEAYKETAKSGIDPRTIEAERQRAAEVERKRTFGVVGDEFLDKHVDANLAASTAREYRRTLKGPATEAWQNRPIATITKQDVVVVIDSFSQRGARGAANRSLSYLRKFFNWCAEHDLIETPPTDRLRMPHRESSRERVLTEQELVDVLAAIQAEPGVFGPVFELVLLTGQRTNEVASMKWSLIEELENIGPVWNMERDDTKNSHPHLVPLAPRAVNIFTTLPRDSELVFTTTGHSPVRGWSKAKKRLDQSINIKRETEGREPVPPWQLRDLRRTMITTMNEKFGAEPHVVEAVVNHVSGPAKKGVAGVYNKALYLPQRRVALNKWADYLSSLETDRRALNAAA